MTTATMERTESSSSPVAEALGPYETIEVWPAGTVLFREGSPAGGVYYLHSGEVDLCFSSPRTGDSRSMLVAGAGQILCLTAVMADRPNDSSATTRGDCITGFIEKNQFLRLLEEKPVLWLNVLEMISSNISACWDCMRNLAGR